MRENAVRYAYKWALDRNPKYYNYDNIGGDCTNFISQCLFAGSGVMNPLRNYGWYYYNANDKSPSWTGVEYLYQYLVRKGGIGPIGRKVRRGDVIQLAFLEDFVHSLIITKIENNRIYVSSHTMDNLNKLLDSYSYTNIRFIHIEKIFL